MRIFPQFFMAQALTFSQIITNSYAVTKTLLKTYVLGALLLIVISMIFRGIGALLFSVGEITVLSDNMMIVITAGVIGFAFTIVGVIFQMLQTMYALVLATDRTQTVKGGIQKAWRYLWRLLVGGMWIMLRSYTWIGFFSLPFFIIGADGENPAFLLIGMIIFIAAMVCAIFFLPRLAFVNVIQLKEGTGVKKSAQLSLDRTRGYWGKIVGNNILMGLSIGLATVAVALVAMLVGFMIVSLTDALGTAAMLIVGLPLGLVLIIGGALYFCAITLFSQIYMVELYETMKANPKPKKA